MVTALAWIGAFVVLGFLIRTLAQGIRTSGLKKIGWFAEFHDDEKPSKQLEQ